MQWNDHVQVSLRLSRFGDGFRWRLGKRMVGRAVLSAPCSRGRLGQPSLPSLDEIGLLDAEEALFPAGAAGETADAPVRRQHAMARDDDRNRVGATGGADGS
jgi:hypothetical protein